MPSRRNEDRAEAGDNAVSNPESKSAQPSPAAFKPRFMMRSRMMGTRGLAASSIGWVLVGCIGFGFGVGVLLDRQLGTTYWMPVMVMVGIAAGFREMFRTLAALNEQPPQKKPSQSTLGGSSDVASEPKAQLSGPQSTLDADKTRPRLFEVPPPPTASFEPGYVAPAPDTADKTLESGAEDDDDPEALIRKLMGETAPDEQDEKVEQPPNNHRDGR